ncbi:hypothetical protein ABZV80_42215 [Streptomyces sp. NPDC005132]|uniref:hypothetical protein n=1 Tax=Streptomyces sp. NPDC005132 TaxID=3154294 RepID=UPI0033A7CB73
MNEPTRTATSWSRPGVQGCGSPKAVSCAVRSPMTARFGDLGGCGVVAAPGRAAERRLVSCSTCEYPPQMDVEVLYVDLVAAAA